MGIDRMGLRGLWEREVITYSDETTDSSKVILWMQARSLYADIRIPRDMAPLPSDLCLDDMDRDSLAELARCGGFGGTIRLQGSTCYWDRDVDWQPDTGVPDVAELALEGVDLIENGGACNGHQVWRRRTTPGCNTLGIRLRDAGDGRSGFLVAGEGRFVYVRGRLSELRPAASLGEVIDASVDTGDVRRLFDAEVSYGTVGDDTTLLVTMSTLPWQIGRDLGRLEGVAGEGDELITADQDHSGSARSVNWQVVGFEHDPSADSTLVGGSSVADALRR